MYSILGIVSDLFSSNMIMMTINCLVYKKHETHIRIIHISHFMKIYIRSLYIFFFTYFIAEVLWTLFIPFLFLSNRPTFLHSMSFFCSRIYIKNDICRIQIIIRNKEMCKKRLTIKKHSSSHPQYFNKKRRRKKTRKKREVLKRLCLHVWLYWFNYSVSFIDSLKIKT